MNQKSGNFNQQYDEAYASNKNWNQNTFAVLHRSEYRYFDAELKRSNRFFDVDAKVLEIGFGNGKFLAFAKRKSWDVTGTELNANLINIAKDKNFNVYEAGTLDLFEADHFDLVMTFDVLEHLTNQEILNLLTSVRRILKTGGVFLARFPNGDSPFGLINQNGDVTHVTAIGVGKAKFYAQKVGLELIFYGGEKNIILVKKLGLIAQNIISAVFKWLINIFGHLVYGYEYGLGAKNSILILKKQKELV